MNRQQEKKMLPIIQALAEGKHIQLKDRIGNWMDIDFINVELCNPNVYRIKPEPKYRLFKNAEECWQEMLKHQPFGWLKHKEEKENYSILKITDSRISMIDVCEEVTFFDYNETFKQYIFADGTPFGIKEE